MFYMNNTDIVIGLFFVLCFAAFAISVLTYIFYSLAFFRFMKSRNLKKAFLAWVPFASYYAVGKVYDDINEKQGKKTNFSSILDKLCFYLFLAIFIPVIPLPLKIFIALSLYFSLIYKELSCYKLILKEYAPDNSNYILLTKIFLMIMPIIPSFCLFKASKNQPISGR